MSISQNPPRSLPLGGPQFGSVSHVQPVRGNLRFLFIILAVLGLSFLWIRDSHPSDLLVRLTKQTYAPAQQIAVPANGTTALKKSTSQASPAKTPGITLELNDTGTTAVIPNNQIDVITEQAKAGDSITRLARHAIAQHLQDGSLTLTPEQRIYAEDFVQKATGSTTIRTGQKLSFATELLDKAIQGAQGLTPRELQNLSHYSARVRF